MRFFYEVVRTNCPWFGIRYELFNSRAKRDAYLAALPIHDRKQSRTADRYWGPYILEASIERGNVTIHR